MARALPHQCSVTNKIIIPGHKIPGVAPTSFHKGDCTPHRCGGIWGKYIPEIAAPISLY